ncbi:S9 family peptidase [Mobilicoccus massiliensis]|uniref:S9 family peptidase n=1 Tax=Mobilicoccus massiliensis TaxID=1522310 RepID=UPI0006940722|nr:S9 family peptidase [Mobilicoccus massiliensis]
MDRTKSSSVPAPLAPHPEARPLSRTHHGDTVVDPYAWLRQADDPEVVSLLEEENVYADAVTGHLAPLVDEIFTEIRTRTKETDLSVPVEFHGWWYYSRTEQGKQYGRLCRVPATSGTRPIVDAETAPADEQVLVDGDVEAAGGEYFALGASEVSRSGTRLAFSVDRSGDERFDVVVREIDGGEVVDESLRGVGYGLVWSADDRYLFYTRVDDAWRPHEVWRHEVGRPADEDVRIYLEEDETFWMGIDESRDERWLVVSTGSRSSSEVHLLDLTDPEGELRCVRPRTPGLEYDVEPAGDELLVVHNAERVDFSVSSVPVSAFLEAGQAARWRPWWTPSGDERVLAVDAFERFVAVSLRSGGLPTVRVVHRGGDGGGPDESTVDDGRVVEIPAFAALGTTSVGENPEWRTSRLQILQESFLTPRRVCEFDPQGGTVEVLKQREVLGGYDPHAYVEERVWVTADDGTRVPMSLVRRAGVPLDGTAPGLLRGYGAYEISSDPAFSVTTLSALDRGVVMAVAHVRGGGEMGRSWWLRGRLADKVNSFTDLVSCARYLRDERIVARDRLALEGGSAGGLLVGAAVNLAPELFRAVHAAVPFVDALTTILDPSLPLTVVEWEEWGNPLADPKIYAVMKAYSPYENVRAAQYPAILATSSLNDTRVQVGEPLKWVTRLRQTVTSDQGERPVVMRTEMVAGHGGRSGRYDAWRQAAFELAFLLDQIGAAEIMAEE